MIDIKIIRESPDILIADYKKRGRDVKEIDEFVELDKAWRQKLQTVESLRALKNKVSLEISDATKSKNEKIKKEKIQEMQQLSKKMTDAENEVDVAYSKLKTKWMRIPNILEDGVPIGKDDSENKEIKKYGDTNHLGFQPKDHQDLCLPLGLIDIERAAKISGARFYFLKKDLALLEFALMRFAMDELVKKGFMPMIPPFMMHKKQYEGVTDLNDFEEVMYKIEGEDEYMIATSEHPLIAMHSDEVLSSNDLPIKMAGWSPCFRKEAGSHGRDTKGIFRVHQFQKIEQIVICEPKDSQRMHKELLDNAEELWQKLEIPYHVVDICTGDIGTVASRKFDIEAWLPGQNKYREVVSGSNCTDYQTRRLNIKYDSEGERKFAHTLNCTGVTNTRGLIAIIENYQTKEGKIRIPDVLQPYMNNKKIIG